MSEGHRGRTHAYDARVIWTGDTSSYASYSREHRVVIAGKPDLKCSADLIFRGDATRHNPEDLFLASIAACHMLTYLALCARTGIRVLSYQDAVSGTLALGTAGGGRFEEVTLRPDVAIAGDADQDIARQLHDRAHAQCFIANSCGIPIRHVATVRQAQPSTARRAVES